MSPPFRPLRIIKKPGNKKQKAKEKRQEEIHRLNKSKK
jgi:hypothetical protein